MSADIAAFASGEDSEEEEEEEEFDHIGNVQVNDVANVVTPALGATATMLAGEEEEEEEEGEDEAGKDFVIENDESEANNERAGVIPGEYHDVDFVRDFPENEKARLAGKAFRVVEGCVGLSNSHIGKNLRPLLISGSRQLNAMQELSSCIEDSNKNLVDTSTILSGIHKGFVTHGDRKEAIFK